MLVADRLRSFPAREIRQTRARRLQGTHLVACPHGTEYLEQTRKTIERLGDARCDYGLARHARAVARRLPRVALLMMPWFIDPADAIRNAFLRGRRDGRVLGGPGAGAAPGPRAAA